MKNLLLILSGIIIGGITVYFLKPDSECPNFNDTKIAYPTSAEVAKRKIKELYDYLSNAKNTDEIKIIFRRSSSILASDVRNLLNKYDTNNDTSAIKLRIYPILDRQPTYTALSYLLMLEEKNGMIWFPVKKEKQDEIQDTFNPCPIDCPPNDSDILKENEWNIIVNKGFSSLRK